MPEELALVVHRHDVDLPATLSMPSTRVRAGIVPLHGATDPNRDSQLFEHLAKVLPTEGIAVLHYDRRPSLDEDDVPFELQAADALAAVDIVRERIDEAPVGLWGYSQGTWPATLAAATRPDAIAFLALVAAPGVSPAEQMRFGTREQVRRAGYDDRAQAESAEVWAAFESFLRGDLSREEAQTIIAAYTERPWFPLLTMPTELPREVTWLDMDFDPRPYVERIRCPVHLFYGIRDEWTPVGPSVRVWREVTSASSATLTVTELVGLGHAPIDPDGSVSSEYEAALVGWLRTVIHPDTS